MHGHIAVEQLPGGYEQIPQGFRRCRQIAVVDDKFRLRLKFNSSEQLHES